LGYPVGVMQTAQLKDSNYCQHKRQDCNPECVESDWITRRPLPESFWILTLVGGALAGLVTAITLWWLGWHH
jgi:hypothetical protein